MRICVQKVPIKRSIRHPSLAVYALPPALEPRLSFPTFQFAAYRIYGVTTKKMLKIIKIMEMVMFTNGKKGMVMDTRKERK